MTWVHTIFFVLIQLINLGMCSLFFINSMSMNEEFDDKKTRDPSMKAMVIAEAPFYFVAVANFIHFVIMWFILFWFIFVILNDYNESVHLDRISILEVLMPGNKSEGFDKVMKERLNQWDRIKRLFYYQLKL